jgi:citrate synthase
MKKAAKPTTRISTSTTDRIYVRDKDLVDELMGRLSFTEMMFFQIMQRMPTRAEARILDAVLVTLMEHGLTPSAIVSRLVDMSAPDALQSSIAAGLLCVGGTFVGTMEGNARLLEEIVAARDGVEEAARRIAECFKSEGQPVPGFGHPLHRPDDPRSPRLLAIAEEEGVPGNHISALRTLGRHVDEVYGRHLTINATGAIAAVLCEIQIPWEIMRGFAVISRCAGLVGHILEEREVPAGRAIWLLTNEGIRYEGKKERGR